jgi:hypothetical protein
MIGPRFNAPPRFVGNRVGAPGVDTGGRAHALNCYLGQTPI